MGTSYTEFVNERLFDDLDAECGDVFEVRHGAIEFSSRLIVMAIMFFVDAYGILPQELVIHSATLLEHEKTRADIYFVRNDEEKQEVSRSEHLGDRIILRSSWDDVTDGLPTHIPYMVDDTLERCVVVARYRVPLCEVCATRAHLVMLCDTLATAQDEEERQTIQQEIGAIEAARRQQAIEQLTERFALRGQQISVEDAKRMIEETVLAANDEDEA